jgi:hypothetical protein
MLLIEDNIPNPELYIGSFTDLKYTYLPPFNVTSLIGIPPNKTSYPTIGIALSLKIKSHN